MRVVASYFSGTDTTKKIVLCIGETLAQRLGCECVARDFTPLAGREEPLRFEKDDVVVLGTPVIAGRVPNLLKAYLEAIQGADALGVPVVLYGNRNFDDALVELAGIMRDCGMTVVGAAAFIGEHSFSKILAAGRPDLDDMAKARQFAVDVAEKIIAGTLNTRFYIRGEQTVRPYYQPRDSAGNPIDIRKVKPKTNDKCTNCKLCVALCPLGSIDVEDVSMVKGICMKCCACIKKCPHGAKYFDDEGYLYHAQELEKMYAGTRREPECFY